jgi:hypothetical protein
MRMDCISSTKGYPVFEALRNKAGSLFVYFGDVPASCGGDIKRRADKAITKTTNISSVFVPDVEKLLGFGDVKSTQDAILIVFNCNYSQMEIFVARGQKNNCRQLYNLLADGELDTEIASLKKQAVTDWETSIKDEAGE